MYIDWESMITERSVEIPAFFDILKEFKPKDLLDVGFAGGWYHMDVVKLGIKFVGLDAAEGRVDGDKILVPADMKTAWKESLQGIQVIVSDIVEWRSKRTFDMVASISTIEHIIPCGYGMKDRGPSADLAAVEKMKTHVAPGGTLCLSFPVGIDGTSRELRPEEFTVYGEERVKQVIGDWKVLSENYWMQQGNKWMKVHSQQAVSYTYFDYKSARTLGILHLGHLDS